MPIFFGANVSQCNDTKEHVCDIIWKFSLEDDTRALEDAKKALHFDGTSVKARRVCAESLFASGQFELGKFI